MQKSEFSEIPGKEYNGKANKKTRSKRVILRLNWYPLSSLNHSHPKIDNACYQLNKTRIFKRFM
uniref:Uncharacterized protein n=1 Tax=Salmonella phage vB_SEnST11_KE23 TaxID=3161174 RepID=A0AAU8GF10_9CAUD